jgi:hypothetical protein
LRYKSLALCEMMCYHLIELAGPQLRFRRA